MFKNTLRKILPDDFRYFVGSLMPRWHKIDTFVLHDPQYISSLKPIDEYFKIRTISDNDLDLLEKYHSYRGKKSFSKKVPSRINSDKFVGLAAIDTRTEEIAYLSWVVNRSIDYFEEFGVFMKKGDFMVKDIFVVPKYRHRGLSYRMEQERINFCVKQGALKIYTQPLTSNLKGKDVYLGLGYKYLQTDLLIQWPVFNVWRNFKSFLRNPFKTLLK